MSVPRFNLEQGWGEDREFRLQIVDELTSAPLPTTSYQQIWYIAKQDLADDDSAAVFQLSVGSGLTALDLSTGLYKAVVPRSATTGLSLAGHDLQATVRVKLGDGSVKDSAYGQHRVIVGAKQGVT